MLDLGYIPLSSALAFSPDGKTLAVAELTGSVRLRETDAGRETGVLEWPKGEVNCLAFSPDGGATWEDNWIMNFTKKGLSSVA